MEENQHKGKNWVVIAVVLLLVAALVCVGGVFLLRRGGAQQGGTAAQPQESAEALFTAWCTDYTKFILTQDALTLDSFADDPAAMGLSVADYGLGEASPAADAEYVQSLSEFRQRLLAIDEKQLTGRALQDYQVLKEDLNDTLAGKDYTLNDPCFTSQSFQAMLAVNFLEFTVESKADLDVYLNLLEQVPAYFDSMLKTETAKAEAGLSMTKANSDGVIEQCREFIATPEENVMLALFEEKLAQVPSLTEEEKAELTQRNHDIVINALVPAYQRIIDTLTTLQSSAREEGAVDGGYYYWLIQKQGHRYESVEEATTVLEDALMDSITTLQSLYTADPDIYNRLNDVEYPSDDAQEILTGLLADTQDRFPALPENVNYELREVPAVLSAYLSPAFYIVPPIDNATDNTIYLNLSGGNYGNELFPTVAHEGVPGHMLQMTTFAQTDATAARHFVMPLAYIEGWASYVEMYSYYYTGWDEDVMEWYATQHVLSLAMYARADIGVNYEGWSRDDLYSFVSMFFTVPQETSDEMYNRFAEQPADYLDYGLGILEVMELRDAMQAAQGDAFDLKAFNTALLECGPCDFTLLRAYLEGWAGVSLAPAEAKQAA